jgi:poly-beta-1,6-N-acetyl-D-glucosamine synthase
MEATTRYVIVTPARDEEQHILATLEAVVRQSLLPQRWIIVDDGSSDRTAAIAERYAEQHAWIEIVRRPDRGARKNGGGVMEAFYEGFRRLQAFQWDFLVKLDADVSFPPEYFERCFQEFAREPSLGIGGGTLYNVTKAGVQLEPQPQFHVRGATKIYRGACWDQIEGVWPGPGWDTIDEVKANMIGWTTRSFASIQAYHHRPTGAAEGRWRDCLKNGRGSYAAGYHPLYLVVRSIARIRVKPYVLGTVAMLYGFIAAYLQGVPRITDRRLIRYIRTQQMNRLLGRPTTWR